MALWACLIMFMVIPLSQSFAPGEAQEVSDSNPAWDGLGAESLWEERPASASFPLRVRSSSVGPSFRHLDLRGAGRRPSLPLSSSAAGRLWEEMPIPVSLLSEESDGTRASEEDALLETEEVEVELVEERETKEESSVPLNSLLTLPEVEEDDWQHALELTILSEKVEDNPIASMKQGEEEETWVSKAPSITDILTQNGFPGGLLPLDAVESYSINDNGEFEVHMQKPCYARIEELIYYDTTISGKVSYGSISDISGIQVKQLFFWISVTDIRVDVPSSDYIYFYVGFISKKLPISMFQEIPECQSRSFEPRFSLAAVV